MKGVRINTMTSGGAADAGGLDRGDVIVTYGSAETPDHDTLLAAIRAHEGADLVPLKIVRDGAMLMYNIQVPEGQLGITISSVEFEAPQSGANARTGATPPPVALRDEVRRMLVTTASGVEGRHIEQTLGIVSAEAVMGINIFGDIMSSFRDLVGGRSNTVQKAMREARRAAIDDLKAETYSMGGNAVIGVRLEYNEFSGKNTSMVMLAAYGTAVTLADR